MKNYIKTIIVLSLFNTDWLTAMEPYEAADITGALGEQNQTTLFQLPDELLLPILKEALDSKIQIDSENIFDAVDEINRHLSHSLAKILLTCRSFFQFKKGLLESKKELIKFYQLKLKETFLEHRDGKEGLYPKSGEWAVDPVIAQKIALFLATDDHLDDHILLNIIHIKIEAKLITELINLLVFFGAELNIKNANGTTALMRTVRERRTKILSMLLAQNPDLNLQDVGGNTALTWAVSMCAGLKAIQLLLAKNPDLNIQNNDGDTALIYAVCNNNKEVVKLFLAKNPDLNLQNKKGDTALIRAVYEGNKEIVTMLLAKNPNLDIQNNDGNTALAIAQNKGSQYIVEILKEHQKGT